MCKKFLFGAILTVAVCLTSCSKDGTEAAETFAETTSAAKTTTAEVTKKSSEDIVISREYEFDLDKYLERDTYNRYALRDELDFLNDEQYDTYIRALILIDNLENLDIPHTCDMSTYYIDENGEIYGSFNCNEQNTGHTYYRYVSTYESFYAYLRTVFTQDAADRIVSDKRFLKRGDELYFKVGDGGGMVYFDDSEYDIIKGNDGETVFEYTAYRSINGEEWTQKRSVKLVNTDNGWRSEFFENLYTENIVSPIAAAEKYLEELSGSENVKAVELHEIRIGQNYFAADKYYESPLAEKFGVTEDTLLVPVNVDYYIEYTENSGLESGEKSDYFIVDQNQNGFCVIDTFPYDPKDYYGEVKEILKDDNGDIDFYMVELDGGLGTVKCNNAAMMSITFEAGTKIYIEANGDIYGETPRLDALHMCEESEMFHAD